MWERISKLTSRQIASIFVIIGLAVFAIGLVSPFQGDDNFQIVNSTPVQSLGNIPELLSSSTFFNGQELVGSYYRPTMTITYATIYTLFGPNPFFFHIVQLALHIAGAFMLYLLLKTFLKQPTAFILAAIFLIHPLNSQVVYAIPSMQDALFFLFGISALWVLIHRTEKRDMWLVIGLLFLSLLSKEVAIIFPVLAALYLLLFERRRLSRYLRYIPSRNHSLSSIAIQCCWIYGTRGENRPYR